MYVLCKQVGTVSILDPIKLLLVTSMEWKPVADSWKVVKHDYLDKARQDKTSKTIVLKC